MIRKALLGVVFASVGGGAVAEDVCGDREPAGIVLQVKRAGVTDVRYATSEGRKLEPLGWICDGDEILIESARSRLVIRQSLGGGTVTELVGPLKAPIKAEPRRKQNPWTEGEVQRFLFNTMWAVWNRIGREWQDATELGVRRASSDEIWGVPGLLGGEARIAPGWRQLVIPLFPGSSGSGRELRVVTESTGAREVFVADDDVFVLPPRTWSSGRYRLELIDTHSPGAPVIARGAFTVAADGRPSAPPTLDWLGHEVAAAIWSMQLLEVDPAAWGLEALQILEAAPEEGLDREGLRLILAQRAREYAASPRG